jgi:hypothetical protein|tara:strand:- start:3171 stop:3365 length:195 start_codon:yes stop_codon:yes gene_type:complete
MHGSAITGALLKSKEQASSGSSFLRRKSTISKTGPTARFKKLKNQVYGEREVGFGALAKNSSLR